jgi:hypothetical protein
LPPPPSFKTRGSVLTVAAAGNTDSTLADSTANADFVARSYGPPNGSFVIVENRRLSGERMCYSSLLGGPNLNSTTRTQLFGLVRSQGTCGSSFAAPRVAWTLAVAETLRPLECSAIDETRRRLLAEDFAKRDGRAWRWPIVYLGAASGYAPIDNDSCGAT